MSRAVFQSAGAVLAAALFALGGCVSYRLEGRVIESDISFAAIVDAGDERLTQPGVAGVALTLVSDPGKLNSETIGSAVSGPDGSFTIDVSAPGAGILLYDVGLSASREGYAPVEHTFGLPPSGRMLLVFVQPGRAPAGTADPTADELYRRFRR